MSAVYALAVVHVFVGLGCAAFAAVMGRLPFEPEYLPIVPHLAMILSQACLLSVWTVLGRSHIVLRLVGFIAGVSYLELVAYLGTQDDDFSWLAGFSAISVAVVLLISRIWLAPLSRIDAAETGAAPSSLQFSIRGLMLLTLGVAAAITVAKALNAWFGGPRLLVELLMWVGAVAVTGLASAWAMLTSAHAGPRAAAVLLLALGAAAIVGYGFNEGWHAYFYLITITVLQAAAVLASLLLVRRSGYRMRRRGEFAT